MVKFCYIFMFIYTVITVNIARQQEATSIMCVYCSCQRLRQNVWLGSSSCLCSCLCHVWLLVYYKVPFLILSLSLVLCNFIVEVRSLQYLLFYLVPKLITALEKYIHIYIYMFAVGYLSTESMYFDFCKQSYYDLIN